MSEYKPITGELRNSMTYDITTAPDGVSTASIGIGAFCDLCDAIDSVHAALEAECERLREQDRDGWVELPKDADNVPICIGDVMVNLRDDLEPQLHHTFKVYSIRYRDYGQACALTEDGYPTILYRANECRHYHASTVEDVLREFAEKITDSQIPGVHPTYEEAIAEYTQRLTLAGEDE